MRSHLAFVKKYLGGADKDHHVYPIRHVMTNAKTNHWVVWAPDAAIKSLKRFEGVAFKAPNAGGEPQLFSVVPWAEVAEFDARQNAKKAEKGKLSAKEALAKQARQG